MAINRVVVCDVCQKVVKNGEALLGLDAEMGPHREGRDYGSRAVMMKFGTVEVHVECLPGLPEAVMRSLHPPRKRKRRVVES